MISCNNICKAYPGQVVLNNFSYEFQKTGFYLLLGESGSGKTTFLNILTGFVPFDQGCVCWDGCVFRDQVETADVMGMVDYITQDTLFVEFLTVQENLQLVCDDSSAIVGILNRFGLGDKCEQRVTTLSGGERQRLAIARSLLNKKKVLILDEPTAALDQDNKTGIFELLSELKKDILVICSSHDVQASAYADETVFFSKEKIAKAEFVIRTPSSKKVQLSYATRKTRRAIPFLRKWFKSEYYNKKVRVLFIVFLTLSLCVCAFADTPESKLESSIEYMYKLNMLTVVTYEKVQWKDIVQDHSDIREVVLDYSYSCPDGNENLDPDQIFRPLPDYEVSLAVLPYKEESFRLSNRIVYGTYFTERNQVLLSWEMATSLAPDGPEKLVGSKLCKNIYGLGQVDLEIVGIFGVFSDSEKVYLEGLDIHIERGDGYNSDNYTELFFVNAKITESLEEDPAFYSGSSSRRGYRIFFDSYADMKEYYLQNYNLLTANENVQVYYNNVNVGLRTAFELLSFVSIPLIFAVCLFAILFYVIVKRTEFTFNNKFISVFEYAGYHKRRILSCFMLLHIFELVLCYFVAIGVAFLLTCSINLLNRYFQLISFQIFSYNFPLISLLLVVMVVSAIIFITVLFRKVQISSWYKTQIENRDLI